jgi:hypothetical protein
VDAFIFLDGPGTACWTTILRVGIYAHRALGGPKLAPRVPKGARGARRARGIVNRSARDATTCHTFGMIPRGAMHSYCLQWELRGIRLNSRAMVP